jgi:uncharacterized protein YaiE (UPF0345 family)
MLVSIPDMAEADTATETVVVTGSRVPQQTVDDRGGGFIKQVDIIVKKNPGGTVVAIGHVSKKSGKFSVQVKEPGQYTISTACKQSACPSYRVLIKASGVPLKHGTGGNFTVGNNAPVVLSGQIQSASLKNTNDGFHPTIDWGDGTPAETMGDPNVAVGDVNGDGKTDQTVLIHETGHGATRKHSMVSKPINTSTEQKTPAPTDQDAGRSDHQDVDIPVPDTMMNMPDVGGNAGG